MRMRHPNRPVRQKQQNPKFSENYITKSGPSVEMDLEYIKTKHAFALNGSITSLRVPKVESYDEDLSTLVLERIKDVVPFWSVILNSDYPEQYLTVLGETVALIHDLYSIPDEYNQPFDKKWSDSVSEVVALHGDLWLSNILFNADTQKIIIVDWSTSPWLERDVSIGSRYLDIGTICLSLFTPPKRAFLSRNYKAEVFVDAFLQGYRSQTSIDFEELYKGTYLSLNYLIRMYELSLGSELFTPRKLYTKYCHKHAIKKFEAKVNTMH